MDFRNFKNRQTAKVAVFGRFWAIFGRFMAVFSVIKPAKGQNMHDEIFLKMFYTNIDADDKCYMHWD